MPFCLWLMGPTSCGKTTIANAFCHEMRGKGALVIHYDGDDIRDMFGSGLSFGDKDRLKVVKTLVYFANKTIEAGMDVIVSALTANQDAREYILSNVPQLITGYIQCSIETCARRDPKGLYRKAKNGEINTLIGFNSVYLPPAQADFIIDSEKNDVGQSLGIIKDYLIRNDFYDFSGR